MTTRLSFTKHEHKILPGFRQKINEAESTQDLKNIFRHAVKDLFEAAFEGKLPLQDEDTQFQPDQSPYYTLSPRLLSTDPFRTLWNDSDLPRVTERLADLSLRRYKRLQKHSEKTDSKIRV